MFRNKALRAVALAAAMAFCQAHAADTKPVSVPAGDLTAALEALAKQSGVELVYRPEQLKGLKTKGVQGSLSSEDAVRKLIEGTSLTLSADPSGVLLISAANAPVKTSAEVAQVANLRVAQSENAGNMQKVEQAQTAQIESSESGAFSSAEAEENSKGIAEILVKGSRVTNMDIKRSRDDAQPYYILDSKTIERSGAANVEDFLKQRLTMNTTVQSNSQFISTLGATGTVNLRGLGSNETLILIDGRRSASVTYAGTAIQPDINGIPLSAIERIEVLPSSASAIYGGSAMGGVVNIILKKSYRGGTVDLTYENTASSDAPRRTVNAAYGFSLENGKTQVMLAGRYSDGKVLLTRDRMGLVDQGYYTILRNNPDFLMYVPSFPILGATPNIGSADEVTALTLKGTDVPLNSLIATIAPGTAATTPASIVAGQWNDTLAETAQSYGLFSAMGSVPRVKSLRASARRELTPSVELIAEFSTQSNRSITTNDPLDTNSVVVPFSSPANPFNQDVRVTFPNTLIRPYLTDNTTQSATLGFLVRLPREWRSELDYTWSRNTFGSNNFEYDTGAFDAALAAGTVNPFVDTLAHPLNLDVYLTPEDFSQRATLKNISLRGSGPVGSFPWGRPTLTVGLEHRNEGSEDSHQHRIFPLTPEKTVDVLYFGQSQSTDSVYAETHVPFVTARNALPLVRALELQLAGRSERYTVHAGTPYAYLLPASRQPFNPPQGVHSMIRYTSNNPTIGLKYKPVDELTFRASYARAFLPPTFEQLLPNPRSCVACVRITDPQNGLTYDVDVTGLYSGNPDLKPQTARSSNLGMIWEPKTLLEGLRLDVEYYRIVQPNYITVPGAQQVVSNQMYANRVVRDPGSGLVSSVDLSYLNATEFKTSGWDLTIDYRRPTALGTFDLHAVGTMIEHDWRQYAIGEPSLDYAGFPSEGGEGKIKANLTLNWEYRQWTFGWTAIYFGNYLQAFTPASPSASLYGSDAFFADAQGGFTIPSQMYHTLFGSYRFDRMAVESLSNLTLQFGIKNLFDTLPPMDVYYEPSFYSPYGDPRLRAYWVGLQKAF